MVYNFLLNEEKYNYHVEFLVLQNFYSQCINDLDLDIIGIMCLPPNDLNPEKYFKEMKKLSKETNLKEISMGMSNDYLKAVENNATFLRIGSSIFGPRS